MAEQTDITTTSPYSDDVLNGLKSFEDALALINDTGAVEDYADEYGTGFEVVEDKGQLVKVPFAILEWRFTKSKLADAGEFVSAVIMTKSGQKLIVNDGSSTGIYHQLRTVTDRRSARGVQEPTNRLNLLCRNGLRVSEYEYDDINAKTGEVVKRPAKTFYLA